MGPGVRRRHFIALFGSAATWSLAAGAQQPDRVRRIGVLMTHMESDRLAAFRKALEELGWAESRNIRMEYRQTLDHELMRRFAMELVKLQPDLIVAQTTLATAAILQETRTIPVVFLQVSDPVGSGFIVSLARPGGNATGFIDLHCTKVGDGSINIGSERQTSGSLSMPLLPRAHAASLLRRDTSGRTVFLPGADTRSYIVPDLETEERLLLKLQRIRFAELAAWLLFAAALICALVVTDGDVTVPKWLFILGFVIAILTIELPSEWARRRLAHDLVLQDGQASEPSLLERLPGWVVIMVVAVTVGLSIYFGKIGQLKAICWPDDLPLWGALQPSAMARCGRRYRWCSSAYFR